MDRMSDCIINPYSSGVCVLGTKSCVMKHTGIVEIDKQIKELKTACAVKNIDIKNWLAELDDCCNDLAQCKRYIERLKNERDLLRPDAEREKE